jgi:hypothetical protein
VSNETVVNLQTKIDEKEARIKAKCLSIASEIDPKAGDFFRRCMARAALLGMQWAQDETNKALANTVGAALPAPPVAEPKETP